MSRRVLGVIALAVAAAVCMTSFAAVVSGKSKVRRVGTSMQVETSTVQKGKRDVVVTGVIQSSVPRCEL